MTTGGVRTHRAYARRLALLGGSALALSALASTPAAAQSALQAAAAQAAASQTAPSPHAPGPQAPGVRKPVVNTAPLTGNLPVTFLADSVSYDRFNGIVSAQGHVQAWQNDHYLAADRVTFDRNTGVAAAHGHVLIVEPDGQIVFGDYAELSQGMKNGVITGMRALLADGGKLAANGARRTEGKLNEMARAVYSTCNVCKLDPLRAPEWQIRADHMTQDLEHKRIEFSDAWVDVYGIPLLYLPYMSTTDPSVKRQSGFLVPSAGFSSEHLGAFLSVPYYWVIDNQSDLTITPQVNALQTGQVELTYRRAFNDGAVKLDGAIAQDQSTLAGYVFANANFVWDDTWRYGANINLGSSVDYLRDYQVTGYLATVLNSNAYIEGFGVGAYSRLDASAWQGLTSSVVSSALPYVLPRYQYDFFSEPDIFGGRAYFDTTDFNVLREQGTDTQRLAGRLGWERPFHGYLGDQWKVTAQVEGEFYHAEGLNDEPNFGTDSNVDAVHAEPQVAVQLNWPFARDGGSLGTQIIEPILQVIAGPQSGNAQHDHLPNEDSLDYEFTDSTLFSLNRFGGFDRYDGGVRANAALHGNWTFRGGQVLDAMIGASLVEHVDHNLYPQFQPWNGFNLGSHLSDIVGRAQFVPYKWIDFTTRARVDHANGDLHYAEGVMGLGRPVLRFNFGYLYGSTDPYTEYLGDLYAPGYLTQKNLVVAPFFTPRNEVSGGVSTQFGHYTLSADARRDIQTGQMDSAEAHAKYEDECTIFDMLLFRRYTSINGDHGNTTVLFTITLKTVGQFGFK